MGKPRGHCGRVQTETTNEIIAIGGHCAASDTAQRLCQVKSLLAVNNRTAITATITALQVSGLTVNP